MKIISVRVFWIAWVLLMLISCRTAKDNRATNRVLTNPELKEKVGREWEKENPCVNDSVAVYIPGDTLIEIDTVYDNDTVRIEKIKTVPYEVIKTRTVTVTRTIHDTIKVSVIDTRRLGIALDSVSHWRGIYKERDAQVNEFRADKKKPGKVFGWLLGALVTEWWFWLIVMIVAGYITRKLWLKFL